ncbi:MAG: allophanate hydrolase subunit 1 [Pseudomonadota bacterium]
MKIRYLPCGDTGLVVQLSDVADRATNACVHRLFNAVMERDLPGVVEAVPSYRSLLVQYDPLQTTQAELAKAIEPLISPGQTGSQNVARRWRLPICCDGEDLAPDLEFVATRAGLSTADVVEILAETEQIVYMLGFAPGQPYLGDLPDKLSISRRNDPIPQIPAGSVVTATAKTVIYSMANPTGWYMLGRTPVRIFQSDAAEPVLLAPGDRLIFNPISRPEFDDLDAQARAGNYQPQPETIA